jgi:ribosome-binding protein aMBF1 (putative translation factor)
VPAISPRAGTCHDVPSTRPSIGRTARLRRMALGMSRASLAQTLKRDVPELVAFERGVADWDAAELAALSRALLIPVDQLFVRGNDTLPAVDAYRRPTKR